jgi:hypothetical protein
LKWYDFNVSRLVAEAFAWAVAAAVAGVILVGLIAVGVSEKWATRIGVAVVIALVPSFTWLVRRGGVVSIRKLFAAVQAVASRIGRRWMYALLTGVVLIVVALPWILKGEVPPEGAKWRISLLQDGQTSRVWYSKELAWRDELVDFKDMRDGSRVLLKNAGNLIVEELKSGH